MSEKSIQEPLEGSLVHAIPPKNGEGMKHYHIHKQTAGCHFKVYFIREIQL